MRILGSGSYAIAAALMAVAAIDEPYERANPHREPRRFKEPVNSGPVIDTTPESKRAKRRRFAREFERANRLSTPPTPAGESR